MKVRFRFNKFWNNGEFWVALIVVLAIAAVYNNTSLFTVANEIKPSIDIQEYIVSADPNTNNTTIDWLNDKNKCLTLLYPYITECGLGVVEHNGNVCATFIIRQSELNLTDLRYIKGIHYYSKYYPMGNDDYSNLSQCNVLQDYEENLLNSINSARENGSVYKANLISSNKELTNKARLHSASVLMREQMFIYDINSPYFIVMWSNIDRNK